MTDKEQIKITAGIMLDMVNQSKKELESITETGTCTHPGMFEMKLYNIPICRICMVEYPERPFKI